MRPVFTRVRSEDKQESFVGRDAEVIAEYRRQKIRRDLSRWSRKVLMCLGLENIGKHIVGESKWEKLYDNGCTRKCSTPEKDEAGTVSTMEPLDQTSPKSSDPGKESPCSGKEEAEPAVETEEPVDQEPLDDEEEEEEVQAEVDIPEDTHSPDASSPNHVQNESKPEIEMNHVVSGSSESSNHSLIADSAANSNSREMLRDEEDAQNMSRSGSTPSHEPDEHEPTSPIGSEAADGEDSGGGPLANNLFQILPYWYFLNRAFSMTSAEGGGGPGPSLGNVAKGGLHTGTNGDMKRENELEQDEDEDEEMVSVERTTPTMHSLMNEDEPPFNRSRSPETTQRLNSLMLLESLQQRLRAQGEQGAQGDMSALNHGLYLSQLLSRMTGKGEEGESRNGSFQTSLSRDDVPDHVRTSPHPESIPDEQPLDLRRSSMKERTEDEGIGRLRRDEQRPCPVETFPGHSSALQLPYVLDEQTSKVFRSNPRSSKGYTAQELQAALHDIQSGKLGTRRAAVIYGIPRSTLRNKVYKLGKDRGRTLQMGGGSTASDFLHLHNNNNNNNNNLRNKETVIRKELLGKLSHFRPLSEAIQSASNSEREQDSGAFGSNSGPPSSIFSAMNGDHNDVGSSGKLDASPSLSHLILKHAQAQKRVQQSMQSRSAGLPFNLESDELRGSLYKDMERGGSSFLSSKDWKEALTRHELLLQHDQRHHTSTVGSGRAHPPQSHLGVDDNSSSMDLAGKKSRPKRGKYRNYDREALVKAVRAVQNGEMSVHRAGSFFGVPHSTLEYKVKERHLLRRPKRKEMSAPLTHNQNKITSAAESSSDSGVMGFHGIGRDEPNSPASFLAREKAKLGNSSGRLSSANPPHLFPVTTDLRESLSRYLNSENNARKKPYTEEADDQDGFDSEDGRNEGNPSPRSRTPTNSRQNEENGEGVSGTSLGGYVGNRLSDLFQLSDIFFRAGGGGVGNDPTASVTKEALLDLSKK